MFTFEIKYSTKDRPVNYINIIANNPDQAREIFIEENDYLEIISIEEVEMHEYAELKPEPENF